MKKIFQNAIFDFDDDSFIWTWFESNTSAHVLLDRRSYFQSLKIYKIIIIIL